MHVYSLELYIKITLRKRLLKNVFIEYFEGM